MDDWFSMSPEEFEHYVADGFRRKGYAVEVTRFGGDFGADLIVKSEIGKAAVQVKQYAAGNNVGVRDVSHVLGAKKYYKCDSALILTTSGFTTAAIAMAKQTGVILWAGARLDDFLGPAGDIRQLLTEPEKKVVSGPLDLYLLRPLQAETLEDWTFRIMYNRAAVRIAIRYGISFSALSHDDQEQLVLKLMKENPEYTAESDELAK